MTATTYLIILVTAFLLTFIASLAVSVIEDISWHDLQDYAKRRTARERVDAIHDGHEAMLLGMRTLLVITSMMVLAALLGWVTKQQEAGHEVSILRILLLTTCAMLTLTVWLPVSIARVWETPIAYHGWRLFTVVAIAVRPLAMLAEACEALWRRLAAKPEELDDEEAFEEEVMAIVTEGLHDGHMDADAREMIEGVIELGDTEVADIMTVRSDIDALQSNLPWADVLAFATKVGRTRIPVYEDSLDNIVGILYVKDLLAEMARPSEKPRRELRELLREVWQVPKTRPLDDLLQDFLQTRNHLAIVVDEYMAVAGLVTIEDVLEEIVGEIVDESDAEHVGEIRRLSLTSAEIQGRAHLAEINEQLGVDLPEPEEFDTIAGLVISKLRRIPTAGEHIDHGDIRVTVVEATRKKVERVVLTSLEPLVQNLG